MHLPCPLPGCIPSCCCCPALLACCCCWNCKNCIHNACCSGVSCATSAAGTPAAPEPSGVAHCVPNAGLSCVACSVPSVPTDIVAPPDPLAPLTNWYPAIPNAAACFLFSITAASAAASSAATFCRCSSLALSCLCTQETCLRAL